MNKRIEACTKVYASKLCYCLSNLFKSLVENYMNDPDYTAAHGMISLTLTDKLSLGQVDPLNHMTRTWQFPPVHPWIVVGHSTDRFANL